MAPAATTNPLNISNVALFSPLSLRFSSIRKKTGNGFGQNLHMYVCIKEMPIEAWKIATKFSAFLPIGMMRGFDSGNCLIPTE